MRLSRSSALLHGEYFSASSGACPGLRRPRPGRPLSSQGPPGGGTAPGACVAWPARRPFLSSPAVVQADETCRSPWPPRRSQARQTLTHSCPEGRRRCASSRSLGEAQLPGGVRERLAGGPGRSGKHGPGPGSLLCRPWPQSGVPRPGSGPGFSGPRVAFAAHVIADLRAGRLLPRAPGAGAGARRMQRGGPGRRRLRRPRGPGACGEPGPTCSESEITLFNYTFPRPPSAIGAF